jgi:hypothetical protein
MSDAAMVRTPNPVKKRCYLMDFVEHVCTHGGSREDADFLWSWLMGKRKELRTGTEGTYLTWNLLLKVADSEPSVELSKLGLWRVLISSIESITRMK